MDWIYEWIRNVAYYYIFSTTIFYLMPAGKSRKQMQFLVGLLLLVYLISPLSGLKNQSLEQKGELWFQEEIQQWKEFQRTLQREEDADISYMEKVGEEEMARELRGIMENEGYEMTFCKVFFDLDTVWNLKRIELRLREREGSEKKTVEELKKEIGNVYNLEAQNIMISIQEQ